MSNKTRPISVAIGLGDTGGHIYIADAIADRIMEDGPENKLTFVGAEGRLDMVPIIGAKYPIRTYKIRPYNRRHRIRNASLIFQLVRCMAKSFGILRSCDPDVVVGTGGYSSGPFLLTASLMRIPSLIIEPNSLPGLTNRLLKHSVDRVLIAFASAGNHFPEKKVINTGIPVRDSVLHPNGDKREACRLFGLNPDLRTILITGGSLGSETINGLISRNLSRLSANNVQVLWQTGFHHMEAVREILRKKPFPNCKLIPYTDRMDSAYCVADLVVSAAGAVSIAELAALGKPAIVIPSVEATEDHQTSNAMALLESGACLVMSDTEAKRRLVDCMIDTVHDRQLLSELSVSIRAIGRSDATERAYGEIIKLARGID
ncbi:MAG: UDP-N-acetylglucosamine--N-acetylmuramyl-(pentapeptide) pyrophosphoryl-undecaprenol N-acetylglucosamine transferase [Deltaproteobacteria bacterium]|nr:UDP-N-acetylglucosamine--N-acetylmuramyl-(pentapeptide) pyrophosphoryl-undecaprenol N-acetylglucosamine transferase [Deltaproteobacteria bacterium]